MEEPKFWIGTSWKMNKNLVDALQFADALVADEKNYDPRIKRFVIPSFTNIREVKKVLVNTSVQVGAQNMHWMDEGAWTGEVSPLMLKECDVDIVELGHSERRQYFGETNETVGLKAATAVRHGFIPLICIGETLEERESGRAQEVLAEQVHAALKPIAKEILNAEVLLAYEPVWAIGVNGPPCKL